MEIPWFVKVKETKTYLIVTKLFKLFHRNLKSFSFSFFSHADVSIKIGLNLGYFDPNFALRGNTPLKV